MLRFVFVLLVLSTCIIALPASAQENRECPEPSVNTPPALDYDPASNDNVGDTFAPQIADYLTVTGSTEGLVEAISDLSFSDQPLIDGQVFENDITGDGEQNVLVSINVTWGAGYNTMLAVFGCADHAYIPLSVLTSGEFFDISGAPPTTIITIIDMNNNQRPEIVQRRGLVQQKFLEAVSIYEWNGGELVSVFSTGFSLGFFDRVEVRAVDDDSNLRELVIGDRWGYGQATAMAVIEIFHWRPIEVTYAWDGNAYRTVCQTFIDDPLTRFETLHSAETHLACGKYDEAMAYYQALLDNDDLEGWTSAFALEPVEVEDVGAYVAGLEYAYLQAFVYYRIVQLNLLAGDVDEAQAILEMALSEYEVRQQGYQYVAMTEALVSNYRETSDLEEACAVAAMVYEQVRESGDDPGIPYYVTEYEDGTTSKIPFYWDSGNIDSSDPDDMFNVPPDIADMITFPICIG